MTKKEKSFDCVEMKNAIQEQLRKEREGLSDKQIQEERMRRLETSDTPAARFWRRHSSKQKVHSS